MIVYRMDPEGAEPIAVECEEFGYPNRDANGETMYVNSHFATLAEAWAAQCADVEAHVSLAGRAVRVARAKLQEAEADAGRAAERYVLLQDAQRATTTAPQGAEGEGC